jgi:hypothetical protein
MLEIASEKKRKSMMTVRVMVKKLSAEDVAKANLRKVFVSLKKL